ncbi:hypothetical protein HY991_02550 [Candidatus Micrarchaeota archaeon]|nr:hypothetical protein [Candidatus Micrarchaeota archaeon]
MKRRKRTKGVFQLIRRLMEEPVKSLVFGKDFVSLVYDGTPLRDRGLVQKRQRHVGEWNRKKRKVYVDDDLNGLDRQAVILHEAIEGYVVRRYGLDVDSQAHPIAEAIEKRWFKEKGGNWRSHQMRTYWVWKKNGCK